MNRESELAALGVRAGDLIADELLSEGWARDFCVAYEDACREMPLLAETAASVVEPRGVNYLELELVCFVSSCVMPQLPNRLRKRRLLLLSEPDAEAAGRFTGSMIDRVSQRLCDAGLTALPEVRVASVQPTMRIEETDQLIDVPKTVLGYYKAHDAKASALKLLGLRLGVELHPASYLAVTQLAYSYGPLLVKLSGVIGDAAFSAEPVPRDPR